MASTFIIKQLEAADIDQVSRFRMNEEDDKPLVKFIRRDARKSAQAKLTQTYVAKLEGDAKVCAYVSIMCAEVALEKSYTIADKVGADRYEYQPAVRIARLAVEDEAQRNGIGQTLVQLVIDIALTQIQPMAGCRFIILDAKQKSVDFYSKLGFRLLDVVSNRKKETPLMFLDLQNLA